MAWTQPARAGYLDQGVFAVYHIQGGAPVDPTVCEIHDSIGAVMDDKLGAAHWRRGELLIQDDRP